MHTPAEIFGALADPTRLTVFEYVSKSEMTVSELTARFEISQPAISQHLATLRNCGLVIQRKQGRQMFYRADPNGIRPVINWLNHYREFWRARLPLLKAMLDSGIQLK
jgi:DNA-binding transcriptional ArsR family regulator